MRLHRSITTRVLLIALFQLVLVGVIGVVVGHVTSRPPPHFRVRAVVAEAAIVRLTPHVTDAVARARVIERFRVENGIRIALFDARGRRIAGHDTPRPPGAPHRPAGSLRRGPPPHDTRFPFEVGGTRYEIAVSFDRDEPSRFPSIITVALGLLVVLLGSLFLARDVVVPLARLAQTARSLGEGNLEARSGLVRDDELGEVGRAFDDMAARLRALLASEKELLANVSHELRTPLARIRVALDIAAEGDSESARASLAEIAVDLAELEGLLDDVFTATRLDLERTSPGASPYALHRELIEPRVLVSRAIERFRSRHTREVVLEADAELPDVEVDPVLVRRVFENLLENAHKYAPDLERPLTVQLDRVGDDVRVRVCDEGIGMEEADLANVFVPFFRSDASRTRGTGGVGLGLTLVKRIIDAHGGRVSIESTLGAGTTVTVILEAAHT